MLVDAHAHVDQYTDNLAEALQQIAAHQILTLSVSMDMETYAKATAIAQSCTYVVPTFGIHPWEAHRYCSRLDEAESYLKATPVVGEAGLDFYWVKDKGRYLCQLAVFEYQCARAHRLSKPVNLHTKGAEREVLKAINKFEIVKPLVHWYSGPLELIDSYLQAGSYFTIGVEVLTSARIQEIAKIIPGNRLLLETDNPGGYKWLTKQTGMPDLLLEVLLKVSGLRVTEPESLEDQLTENWADFAKGIEGITTQGEALQ
jgi:TatD DNase family protein